MNKRQRSIIINFVSVIVITAVAIIALINFKDYVNWSESMQAMNQLSQIVGNYRKAHGMVPPESYINDAMEELQGKVRLGQVIYRARWLDFDAGPDEILAYVKKSHNSFLVHDGYVVMRLDGRVEWMEPKEFEKLLDKQQSLMEKESRPK
jgi:hypothetical protein